MKKSPIVFGLFLFILVAFIVGGSWTIGYAAGTVPFAQPVRQTAVPAAPLCPIGLKVEQEVTNAGQPVVLPVDCLGKISFGKGNLSNGEKIFIQILDPKKLSRLDTIFTMSSFFKVSGDITGKYSISIKLGPAELAAFQKNADMGFLWYNPDTKAWVHLPAVLKDGVLTVEVDHLGIFNLGYLL